jgi:hypothetical protein
MSDDMSYAQAALDIGTELRVGWKRADPAIEADAKALWARLAVLPGGIDPYLRADEIVSAGYVDDQLASVTTAFVRDLPFLRQKFAMLRVLVAPEFRLHSISRLISSHSRDVLEQWSEEHPEEAVAGMATVHQADLRNNRKSRPVKRGSRMVLVGYTTEGEKILVAWFDHVRV